MRSSNKNTNPKILMLLASLPPMPVGGAEMQGIKLIRHLNSIGIKTEVITWGKLWHKRKDVYNGIAFTRIQSVFNLLIDLPSLLKRKNKRPAADNTKIIYNDKTDQPEKVTGKVGLPMILRYQLFYFSALLYCRSRKKEFDIIHVHMMEWPAWVGVKLGKALNKPVLIKDSTVNGIFNILRYPEGTEKQKEIVSYAHCVAMTAIIQNNYLKAGIPEERIFRIPNGIEITPLPVKKNVWRQKVIFIGNLTQQPAKGVDILLLAWKKVMTSLPSATLQVVGEGNLQAYRIFADENGIGNSVEFMGKRKDTKELLLDADVFVLPSRREGMSNALLEAMVCGVPVVATNISGSQDLIENKISGLLVPSANAEELANALIFMLSNPAQAKAMSIKAYENVKQKCDINLITKQYADAYNQILQKV